MALLRQTLLVLLIVAGTSVCAWRYVAASEAQGEAQGEARSVQPMTEVPVDGVGQFCCDHGGDDEVVVEVEGGTADA